MNVFFGDDCYLQLERQDGHLYLRIRAVFAGGDVDGVEIPFILDTGAFMTVVSRDTARRFGFDKLPMISSKIKGYSGEEAADFVRIPSLKILESLLTDVPVLIPHSSDLEQNIIGLNVLEYFNYYIETENDRFYLSRNPKPRHYNVLLECGRVFEIQPDEQRSDMTHKHFSS